ncbi:hypothetical protein RJT34_22677 [Clitoria ternatea]|uniref:Uncharacterized protein n=1 Tax=Clitoria ternatea TaxID=43366 RepID=A0AAN9FJH7_CLITE
MSEVIPFMSQKLPPATPAQDMGHGPLVNDEVESEGGNGLRHRSLVENIDVGCSTPHTISPGIPKIADYSFGEIIQMMLDESTLQSPLPTPPPDKGHGTLVNEVESEEEGNRLRHCLLVEDIDVGCSSAPYSTSVEISSTTDHAFGTVVQMILEKSKPSSTSTSNDDTDKFHGMKELNELHIFQNGEDNFNEEAPNNITHLTSNSFSMEASENLGQGQLHADVDCEKLISSGIFQEMEPGHNYVGKEVTSTDNNGNRIGNDLNEEWVDFVGPSADNYDATISGTGHRSEKCETAVVESSEAQAGCHVEVNTLSSDASPSTVVEAHDAEDELGGNNVVSGYSQVCRVDQLEEIIDEAKTNKKTLFSSMESLINLMREVELQETAAEQANREVATGGSNILARVEEYKTTLVQAKEANDMHAGEVYGEKAILATELKELQSRLLSLSDERDKSLSILNEMRQILEARLAAAEEMRKAAEHEKLRREESARKTLVEQEALVEKVVKESVRLQQEAEENSKLREFLMDRGRVVDMLQGEISVICQDIRLLKEKFDANLPLSKSFTSSQTTCILASSGSSHKTLASDTGSEHSDSSEMRRISPAASIESLSSKSGHDEEKSKADHNAFLDDDGWDIVYRSTAERGKK